MSSARTVNSVSTASTTIGSANLALPQTLHTARLAHRYGRMIDLLAWTRRLVAPRGTLILHISGWLASSPFENYGDLIVNMEENPR
jgi:hypothetical protein